MASYSKGYNVSYNSLANQFSWNTSCSVTVLTVSVVYDLESKGANYTLAINLNPSLTAVKGVTEYPAQIASSCFSSDGSSGCNVGGWVGVEYKDSAGMTAATSEWDVPEILGAGGETCTCVFLQWTGLATQAGGGSSQDAGLAQAGTEIECTNASCTSSYYDYEYWYDFPNSDLVFCDNDSSLTYGDTVETSIYPGSGYTNYYADVYDFTHSVGCDGKSPNDYMGEAYYAEYMGESNSLLGQLIDFSTVSFSSSHYGDLNGDGYYISSSWTNEYLIDQTSSYSYCDADYNYNVCIGAISSGSFTLTYETGSGT